jgi:hypothetical protein
MGCGSNLAEFALHSQSRGCRQWPWPDPGRTGLENRALLPGQSAYTQPMTDRPDGDRPVSGLIDGLSIVALRLLAFGCVAITARYVNDWFGFDWLVVFILALVALRMHFEIAWIERNADELNDEPGPDPNRFRKR